MREAIDGTLPVVGIGEREDTEGGNKRVSRFVETRKVLFIASLYSHLRAFHIPFIRLLQEWGCDVHAAASSTEGGREEVEKTGAICWEIPFRRSPYSIGNIQAFRQLKKLLMGNHYDLIHVHTPVASFMGRLVAKATHQGAVLYTVHGFHFYKGAPLRNWLIYYTAERIAARWTDGLIVMNDEDYQSALRMGFKPEDNLFRVHGVGVDLDYYSSLATDGHSVRAELGISPSDVVVTCVAELIPRKNHVFLLDAWALLSKRVDRCHLLLVGGGDSSRLQRKVDKERIPRVHFLGWRRDIPRIFQATDISVLVSRHEGLPRCVMEAAAAGKPVVASDIRGNRELVDHGRTGFLVKLGDATGLAAALEKLAVDQELRVAMGSAGRVKIQDYSLERVIDQMANVYQRFLS